MSKKRLNEKQIAAIALLTELGPEQLTYEEIAERIGVTPNTLRRWRTENDVFINEVIAQTRRNAVGDLPRVMRAIPNIIVDDKNAAMFRTWLQAIGALTEKVEIDTKSSGDVDMDAMKAQVERFRTMGKEDDTQ